MPVDTATTPQTYRVLNTSDHMVYFSNVRSFSRDYGTIQEDRFGIGGSSDQTFEGMIYYWHALQSELDFYLTATGEDGEPVYRYSYPIPSGPPDGSFLGVPGAVDDMGLTFDKNGTPNYTFKRQSKLGTFLHDLIYTNKYDADWPEDHYTDPGLVAAYDYIVSHLPGQAPPKNGTVNSGDLGRVICPDNPTGFTKDQFNTVWSHLSGELGAFEKLQSWFDTNGHLESWATTTNQIASESLTVVINMLGTQSRGGDEAEIIFKTIFEDLLYFVGLIPQVGEALEAVTHTIYSALEAANEINKTNNSNAVKAEIAHLAEKIMSDMMRTDAAIHTQFKIIGANYGKLQALNNAVASGFLTTDMFYGESSAAEAATQTYTDACMMALHNAWEVSFYKALVPLMQPNITGLQFSSTDGGANGWDPDNKAYTYRFSLPATYRTSRGDEKGYVIISFMPGGSASYHQRLFASNQFAIDPVACFFGRNGWAESPLHYQDGMQFEMIDTVQGVSAQGMTRVN